MYVTEKLILFTEQKFTRTQSHHRAAKAQSHTLSQSYTYHVTRSRPGMGGASKTSACACKLALELVKYSNRNDETNRLRKLRQSWQSWQSWLIAVSTSAARQPARLARHGTALLSNHTPHTCRCFKPRIYVPLLPPLFACTPPNNRSINKFSLIIP